jgi:hypothetical protein
MIKTKRTCKLWRKCPYYRRSECDDNIQDTKDCSKYQEYQGKKEKY